jgi:uncharacterized protein YkwD
VSVLAALICAFGALGVGVAAARHKHKHHRARHGGRCVGANSRADRASLHRLRAAVVCLINKERRKYGLPPLHASKRLNRSAQGWTNDMVARSYFAHGDPGSRISGVGYRWTTEGENIATGFRTPRQVVTAWMHSAGHCANILSPNYHDVGTGVNGHPVSGYARSPATWTQDFGRLMGRGAPSGNSGPASSCPH